MYTKYEAIEALMARVEEYESSERADLIYELASAVDEHTLNTILSRQKGSAQNG